MQNLKYIRDWQLKNPAKRKKAQGKYDKKHRKENNIRLKIWRKNNPIKVKEYQHKQYIKYSDKYIKYSRKWQKEHPVEVRMNKNEYERKKRENILRVKHQRIDYKQLYKSCNSQCVYCGSKDNLQVDHYYPLSLTKDKRPLKILQDLGKNINFILLCKKHNNKKSNKLPLNFVWDNA